jgi:hypothetical protein
MDAAASAATQNSDARHELPLAKGTGARDT